MKNALLQGRGLCKTFSGGGESTPVLSQVDVDIYEEDFTVIMGASGAGKSTLLYCLSGMDRILSQMHLGGAKNRLPAQVSGGEAQRAAIARATINDPGLIFADEPTGALNKSNSEEVLSLLSALNRAGQSILMVTHDVRAAIRGNRILYLEDGKILDELALPVYGNDQARDREAKATAWLSSLQW